jgi:hypothetical protein
MVSSASTYTSNRNVHALAGRALLFVLTAALMAAAILPGTALARTTRAYQSSIETDRPTQRVAVDQSTGDVYIGTLEAVTRFDSSGAPKNFTAGPFAGSNEIGGLAVPTVAFDNSGGPLNGDFYIAQTGSPYGLEIYAASGERLGAIKGTALKKEFVGGQLSEISDIAVDQSDGSLYIAARGFFTEKLFRFVPASPAGAIDDNDYVASGLHPVAASEVEISANDGTVYTTEKGGLKVPGPVRTYSASSFTPDVPIVEGNVLDYRAFNTDVDPQTGDVYANEGNRVSVFDAGENLLYQFGFAAYMGAGSPGIAVKDSPSGSAERAYVVDRGAHAVRVFGPITKLPTISRSEITAFGPDGTANSSFKNELPALAFDQANRRLFAVGPAAGIYGFDASAPPAFPLLPSFDPLDLAVASGSSRLAVDNSGLGSAGRIYLLDGGGEISNGAVLYGFAPDGSSLPSPFPLDPAVSPGAPAGSPKRLCGDAVDSAGNIWIANGATRRILEYSSAGAALPGTFSTESQAPSGEPCQLAFDSHDNLYVGFAFNSVWRYSAASGYTSATKVYSHWPSAIAVDQSDDHLFIASRENDGPGGSWLDELDSSGNLVFEHFVGNDADIRAVTVDSNDHDLYIGENTSAVGSKKQVHVFGAGALLPETLTKPASEISNNGATLNGTVNDQEVALSDCHFEYVTERAFDLGGFSDLSSGGVAPCAQDPGSIPLDLEEHPVSAAVSGLTKGVTYRFRLSATSTDGTTKSLDASFTSARPPLVETTGSPVRTATSVRLDSRVGPANAPTTYHFEYGVQGPCDSSPCTSTEPKAAGSGATVELVSQQVEGLQPNTTYHYRVVADNGNSEGVAFGGDRTFTTWASSEPLTHGHFPGPPGSDRAYEMVSLPDTSGNPVNGPFAISDSGDRVVYQMAGGNPISNTGNLLNQLFAQRVETAPHQGSWESKEIYPARKDLVASGWRAAFANGELSRLASLNTDNGVGLLGLFRLSPDEAAKDIFQVKATTFPSYGASDDLSRLIMTIGGSLDPEHPVDPQNTHFYDVTSGVPKMIDLLPGNVAPTCRILGNSPFGMPLNALVRVQHWLSADGKLAFFPASSSNCLEPQLYERDIEGEETKLLSGPVVSGPECGAAFIRSTPDTAFFWTQSRLDPADTAPSACGSSETDGDVYRYDLGSGDIKCVTCVAEGKDADVFIAQQPDESVAISDDGSHVYFHTNQTLLPGAGPGIYRVDVADGSFAFVGFSQRNTTVGDILGSGQAISPDGSVLIFAASDAGLNAIGGQQNGHTLQYYRYDDRDRSLICVSCPTDGSVPFSPVKARISSDLAETGPNTTPLSSDGETFAFATPSPLLPSDQNTTPAALPQEAGTDVYEWRDGRLLLVTDGLTNWPVQTGGVAAQAPEVDGVSRSGKDVYFTAAAQYTQDALDGYARFYDARIGGGFEFPPPPKPCPLEVCQGTPKGAPEEQAPGTFAFGGPGNAHSAAHHKKTRKKRRHHKKTQHKRANHKRRTAR